MGVRSPTWIWNKGLAARCDRRIPDEFPNGYDYVPVPAFAGDRVEVGPLDLIDPAAQFDDIGGGELVWVRGAWLPSFVDRVLPRIRGSFVLVTGDTPSSMPAAARKVADALLESPYLLHWYTQNFDGTGPSNRMSPVPIGIDFHTRSERPAWGEEVATPAEQAAELEEIAQTTLPLAERIPAVYVDFGWSTDRTPPPAGARLPQPRAWVVAALRAHPLVVLQDTRLPRNETWRRRSRYAFSVSPHGLGLDCHRTWEGLALGQVVLVPSSSLDPIFDGIRAFPVARWQDLTNRNLAGWLEAACALAHPSAALTSDHWIKRMRSVGQLGHRS